MRFVDENYYNPRIIHKQNLLAATAPVTARCAASLDVLASCRFRFAQIVAQDTVASFR